ncbi:MAG TPA: hypothetical protein VFW14_07460 [Gaiellales bacterium]|nr:hypothetical protein [Gaiellales bacterium]
MHATSTSSGIADAIGRHAVSIAACGALVCALSPILGLFRAGLWPVVFNATMPVGIVLTAVALWTTRGRPMHRLRPVALAALMGLATWTLMFVGVFLALLFA